MSAAQTLRPGRYRHFKGKEYEPVSYTHLTLPTKLCV